MGFVTDIFKPSVPSMPAVPAAPPPPPDVNSIKNDISQQESLARKPKGRQANILTGSLGDSSSTNTAGKTLLG